MWFLQSNLLHGRGFLYDFDESLSLVAPVGPSVPCEYYFGTYSSVWLESGKGIRVCWNNQEQGKLLNLNKAILAIVQIYIYWAFIKLGD